MEYEAALIGNYLNMFLIAMIAFLAIVVIAAVVYIYLIAKDYI